MNIIKPGRPPGAKRLLGNCNRCGCVFACWDFEATADSSPMRAIGLPNIACPTCRQTVLLDEPTIQPSDE